MFLNGGHKNEIYTPTGPESLTFTKAASIISEASGKTVEYVSIPVEAVGEAIRPAGWGDWIAQVMMDYSSAYSEGWGDFTNDDVEMITGKKARSFNQFFEEVLSPAL